MELEILVVTKCIEMGLKPEQIIEIMRVFMDYDNKNKPDYKVSTGLDKQHKF